MSSAVLEAFRMSIFISVGASRYGQLYYMLRMIYVVFLRVGTFSNIIII